MQPNTDPQPQYPSAPAYNAYTDQPQITLGAVPSPTPPPQRRNPLIAILALLLALLLGFGVVVYLRNQGAAISQSGGTTTASRIVSMVQQDKARDATFNLSGTISSTTIVPGKTITTNTTLEAPGTTTRQPNRSLITLHVNTNIPNRTPTTATFEEIADGDTLYIKDPSLTKNPAKPWLKITRSGLSDGRASVGNFLDFQSLQGQQLVGEDTISGKKAWHFHIMLANVLASGTPGPSATLTAIAQSSGLQILDFTEDVYFFEDTAYPAKIVLHEKTIVGTAGSGSPIRVIGNTYDETVMFTAWNSGLTITPPAPNEVSSGPKTP